MAAGSWAEDQVCPGLEGAGIRVCAEANRLAGPGHRPWLGNLAPHGHGETSVSNRLAPCPWPLLQPAYHLLLRG